MSPKRTGVNVILSDDTDVNALDLLSFLTSKCFCLFLERKAHPRYWKKFGNIAVKLNFDNEGPTFQERLLNSLKECSKNS